MRILFLHKFNFNNSWGGSASYLRALYVALTKMGHNVNVVSPTYPDIYGFTTCQLPFEMTLTFGPEKRPGETTLDELSTEQLESMAEKAAEIIAAKEFPDIKPDLIIANHINLMALVAWRLSNKFDVPYRIISYGTDTQLLLKDQRYCHIFGNAARCAERILSISGFVAKEIESTVGGSVEVLGGGVDLDLFYPSPSIPKVKNRLVFFGRLVTEKGLWTLLEAFSLQNSAAELELVGEGPLRSEIETFLSGSPLRERVKLTDYVAPEHLRDILVRSGLAVVPSIWQEPLGLVVLEAMACGLPVVASSVGGIPEMISDRVNGLLVTPGDPLALATAIENAIGDPSLYERLLDGVRQTAIPSYDDLARRLIG
ncbi:MAG: glycosyltransferase family 4 protein [Syntrophus sp. (in: bacteria)]